MLRDRTQIGELVGDQISVPAIMQLIARQRDAPERPRQRVPDWLGKLAWPTAALAALLLFNLLFTKQFFHIEVRDGHLYGTLIDILNHGSRVMLLSLGMTLVIATGGVDLSVGAVMAIAGAVAAGLINVPGLGFPTAVVAALAVSLVAGAWNGLLVAACACSRSSPRSF